MSGEPAQRAGNARGETGPAVGRVPDFFIAGHHKSGTTALHAMLCQHPQIFMPELKEPHFMATDRRNRFGQKDSLPQTLEEYLALFEPARGDQLAGEASASYVWSRTAASEIARLSPDARIICVLREPASHLRSLHLGYRRLHWEDRDLRSAIAVGEERRRGREIPKRCPYPEMVIYADQVNYVEQLQRFDAHFPREQVLVLIYDDFRADNLATMRQIAGFLGIDEEFPFEEVEANRTTRAMRAQGVDDALLSLTTGSSRSARAARSALRVVPRGLRRGAVGGIRRRVVFGPPPAEDQQLMAELRRRYQPEVVALGEYLDRDLVTLWGYDDLA